MQHRLTNLTLARRAIDYVGSVLHLGASNKAWDLISSGGRSALCVLASRSVSVSVTDGVIPDYVLEMAVKAQSAGCGNCGEQAAIAFVHLYRELSARPIDFMSRTHADHAFVVLGRPRGSQVQNYRSWGPGAVVCDPWDRQVYPANEIPMKMHGGGSFHPEAHARIG